MLTTNRQENKTTPTRSRAPAFYIELHAGNLCSKFQHLYYYCPFSFNGYRQCCVLLFAVSKTSGMHSCSRLEVLNAAKKEEVWLETDVHIPRDLKNDIMDLTTAVLPTLFVKRKFCRFLRWLQLFSFFY